jgi:hypothetical protein
MATAMGHDRLSAGQVGGASRVGGASIEPAANHFIFFVATYMSASPRSRIDGTGPKDACVFWPLSLIAPHSID